MADFKRNSTSERDTEQALIALKKGANLLKYGRLGRPKFFYFRLCIDQNMLIWTSGNEEKYLKLSQVSKIVPGQRTAIFQRYPRPEKECQSFSLIYGNRSLDLMCKDREEAEVWLTALRALVPQGNYHKRNDVIGGRRLSSNDRSPHTQIFPSDASSSSSDDPGDWQTPTAIFQARKWKTLSDIITFTAASKPPTPAQLESSDNQNNSCTTVDPARISLSSGVSSSSQGSSHEDFDALGDVFIWGECIGSLLVHGSLSAARNDILLPKVLEAKGALSVQTIACGSKHAMFINKRGEIFSWGEGGGGKLGHGTEVDISHPKLIHTMIGSRVETAACGDNHTCVVTISGDLYTCGDGDYRYGILGHGSEINYSILKKVSGQIEGVPVSSVSCGPWHTATVTSSGKLFTFGDGTFGALGHGDRGSTIVPREVKSLEELHVIRASCGVWHTAAVVKYATMDSSSPGKLFTWGDGDKGQLGHGDKECRLVPSCVASADGISFCQVACGDSITIGLTTTGKVYTMGCNEYGQLGSPGSVGNLPTCIKGSIRNSHIKDVSCGSNHVAVLSSQTEVYTWGKGANGQLGHGDTNNRNVPTLVEALKEKQVTGVVCGSNFTAAVGIHNCVSNIDHSICSSCHIPFNFMRKRHNCYNCGLVVCSTCSSKKSLKASLAPDTNRPYRVCDDCFVNLENPMESGSIARIPKVPSGNIQQNSNEVNTRETPKFLGSLSKISSFDSVKDAEYRYSNCSRKLDVNSCPPSPNNGSFQWGSFQMSRALSSMFGKSQKLVVSVPGSRLVSRATSPVSVRSSPCSMTTSSPYTEPVYPDVTPDDSKQVNDSLAPETLIFRSQVEHLTRKSKVLEAELERTSRQLKEVSAVAQDEAEKNKAAKEALRSLIEQLKEMAERAHGESSAERSSTNDEFGSTLFGPAIAENHNPTSADHEFGESTLAPVLSVGNEEEFTVKDETLENEEFTVNDEGTSEKEEFMVKEEETSEEEEFAVKDEETSEKEELTVKDEETSEKEEFTVKDEEPSEKEEFTVKDEETSEKEELTVKDEEPLEKEELTMKDEETSEKEELTMKDEETSEKEEFTVKDEPGIYLTLSSLPGGGDHFKQVQISQKHFSSGIEAEKWWEENISKLLEQQRQP